MSSGNCAQRRRAAGLCTWCKAPSPVHWQCDACRAQNKLYSKRHREKLKQLNRCTRCGAALGGDTRLECADCRLQRKINDAKRAEENRPGSHEVDSEKTKVQDVFAVLRQQWPDAPYR